MKSYSRKTRYNQYLTGGLALPPCTIAVVIRNISKYATEGRNFKFQPQKLTCSIAWCDMLSNRVAMWPYKFIDSSINVKTLYILFHINSIELHLPFMKCNFSEIDRLVAFQNLMRNLTYRFPNNMAKSSAQEFTLEMSFWTTSFYLIPDDFRHKAGQFGVGFKSI